MALSKAQGEFNVSSDRTHGVFTVGAIPQSEAANSLLLLAFLDVSGSMGKTMVFTDGESGVQTDKGYNVLDYAKWAVLLMMEGMGPGDTFVLIAYTNPDANTVFSGKMDDAGKAQCRLELLKLQPSYGTNFENAISTGFDETLKFLDSQYSTAHWIFSTDGKPVQGKINELPQMVHEKCQELETRGMHVEITTVALGGEADSGFLNRMNESGTLIHSVDPATSVLQMLVHLISRMRCTALQDLWIGIDPNVMQHTKFQDGEVRGVGGRCEPLLKRRILEHGGVSWTRVGPLRCTATQTVLVNACPGTTIAPDTAHTFHVATRPPFLATADFFQVRTFTLSCDAATTVAAADNIVVEQRWLARIVNALFTGANTRPFGLADLQVVHAEITACTSDLRHAMSHMIPTMESEMIPGFETPTAYHKWGRDYARALAMAILRKEQTNDFDEALRPYATPSDDDMTGEFVDRLGVVIPPPPSKSDVQIQASQRILNQRATENGVSTLDVAASHTRASRADVAYAGGGCFSPDSQVPILDVDSGEIALMCAKDVVQGMHIVMDHNTKSTVIVQKPTRTPCGDQEAVSFVEVGGVQLTEWHPVSVCHASDPKSETWTFPCKLDDSFRRLDKKVDYVCNFLTTGPYFADAAGNRFVLLAHGIEDEGDVVGHELWGKRIREILEKQPNYASSEWIELTRGPTRCTWRA